MRLEDKVAIITGASGGIGATTAKRFLEEGAKAMLVGRSKEKLEQTRDTLAAGSSVAIHVAEAGDEAANEAAVEATLDQFGGVDIMVANAGTEGVVRPLETQSMADFEAVLRTNVLGVWLSMKLCVEPMKRRGGGSIIALSSIAGVIGSPGLLPYIASKHAVLGMVRTAAIELGEFGIRVNAIGPGPIQNRMIDSIIDQAAPDDPAAMAAGVRDAIPLKRFGNNEEVANLALFLASDESSYCSGGIHMIDGGYTAA